MATYNGRYSMDDPMRYRDPAYTDYLIQRAREIGQRKDEEAKREQKRLEKEASKAGYAQLAGQIGGMAAGYYGASLIKDAFTGKETVKTPIEYAQKLKDYFTGTNTTSEVAQQIQSDPSFFDNLYEGSWLESGVNTIFGDATAAGTEALINSGSDVAFDAFDSSGAAETFLADALADEGSQAALDAATDAASKAAQEAASQGTDAAAQAASEAAAESLTESGVSVGDVGTAAGWIYEAYQAYGTITDDNMTDEQKGQAIAKQAALAVADYWTFGLASLAYAAASTSGEFREAEETFNENDPTVQAAGSTGKIVGGSGKTRDYINLLQGGSVIGGTILNATGLPDKVFGEGKGTEDYQRERWDQALSINDDYKSHTRRERRELDEKIKETGDLSIKYNNPEWTTFYGTHQDQIFDDGKWTEETDPTGRFIGKDWNIEDAVEIAKEAPDTFMLNYANFQASGGDEWFDLTDEQRRDFITRAANEGLYTSDKGSILFSEKKGHLDRAKQIYEDVKNGVPSTPITEQPIEGMAMADDSVRIGPATPEDLNSSDSASALAQALSSGDFQNGLGAVTTNQNTPWVADAGFNNPEARPTVAPDLSAYFPNGEKPQGYDIDPGFFRPEYDFNRPNISPELAEMYKPAVQSALQAAQEQRQPEGSSLLASLLAASKENDELDGGYYR